MTDKQQTIAQRQEEIAEFLNKHETAQEDESEMYDEFRTQAEVDVVIDAIEESTLPESLDRRDSTGPKDIDFYGVKGYLQTWRKCLNMDESDLRDKLESLQQVRENKRKPKYRDGSYNQFLAWNTACQNAVRWLLGEHDEQQGDNNE